MKKRFPVNLMAVMPAKCNPADIRCSLCNGLSEAQVPQTGDHTVQESVIQRECNPVGAGVP